MFLKILYVPGTLMMRIQKWVLIGSLVLRAFCIWSSGWNWSWRTLMISQDYRDNNVQRSNSRTEISSLKVQNYFLIILVTLLEIVLEMRLPDDSSINLQRKTTAIYQKISLLFNLLKENRLRKTLSFFFYHLSDCINVNWEIIISSKK